MRRHVTTRDHLTALLADLDLRYAGLLQERDRRYEQRFAAFDAGVDTKILHNRVLIEAQAERVALALTAADRAVTKAEIATERRFEGVNEFRQQLGDQAATFISRVEFSALRDSYMTRIDEISSRLDKTEGRSGGLTSGWLFLVGAISVFSTLVGLYAALHK